MAQVAIHEAKKVLRRELKKRIAGMSDELKLKESVSIMNKVRTREPVSDRVIRLIVLKLVILYI